MVLMQQAEVDLIRPPLPVARIGGWGDGSGVATEGAFQLRHKKTRGMVRRRISTYAKFEIPTATHTNSRASSNCSAVSTDRDVPATGKVAMVCPASIRRNCSSRSRSSSGDDGS